MTERTRDEQIDIVTQHFIIAAIWADCEEGTHPRITAKSKVKAREYCADFIELCEKEGGLFTKAMARFEHGYGTHHDAGSAEAAFGHDFWLTSQGHGVGFWDREPALPRELGDRLSKWAKTFSFEHDQYRGWFYIY